MAYLILKSKWIEQWNWNEFRCAILCFSTRPWDPLNDLIQLEKDGCIQTKVRHRTPMVRSASVVSLSTQQGPRRDNYLSQVRPPVLLPTMHLSAPSHRRTPACLPACALSFCPNSQSSAAWPDHMTTRIIVYRSLFVCVLHLLIMSCTAWLCVCFLCSCMKKMCLFYWGPKLILCCFVFRCKIRIHT